MSDIQYDVAVLGSGPGGYAAAFRAADLGKKVALIERYEQETSTQNDVRFYHGAYIQELAVQLFEKEATTLLDVDSSYFANFAKETILEEQKLELASVDVHFDQWVSESSIRDAGAVEQTLEVLQKLGKTYDKDSAVWFRSTEYGDDNDKLKRVVNLLKYGVDIAYHWNKFQRDHHRLINVWGADHHGHVPRMKAAIQALGYQANQLEVLLGQMVNLYWGQERVRMSKRTGDMVTFAEVIQEVGKDATRYLLMQRSSDSTLDFDLELAKKASSENPVFYVQYAHARICSIFMTAKLI